MVGESEAGSREGSTTEGRDDRHPCVDREQVGKEGSSGLHADGVRGKYGRLKEKC